VIVSKEVNLKTRTSRSAIAERTNDGTWRLEVPPGPAGRYRLAQIDDYGNLSRRSLPWRVPARLKLRARASSVDIPGTWGFGFWNDPFTMGIIQGVEMLRLPALPNTAWFFIASEQNYLSLRDDLPANGPLSATFRSPHLPSLLLALGSPLLVGMLIPAFRGWMRRLARRFVKQGATRFAVDLTGWHTYEIDWREQGTSFFVDGQSVLQGAPSPKGPLGLVIWVDNQYAAYRPDGKFQTGTCDCQSPSWIEVEDIRVETSW
jgi:hypothetical protein